MTHSYRFHMIWIATVAAGVSAASDSNNSDHWSTRFLMQPPVPVSAPWARNPIDAFIAESHAAKGITPAREADRRTLIRRVTYDLHGLPPTPEEVAAFVADVSPDAYGRLVERLLASPRYGERWARHWLDVVHFGETHGFDKDQRRDNAWRYRDYVIDSLNADKPYGQFVREQIAGDVLYPGEAEGVIATGFLAAGPWDLVGQLEVRENTVEKARVRRLDRDDIVANVFNTFLSTTVQCAQCHDHKYDPIAQREYYGLQAVFAGIDRGDRELDSQGESTDAEKPAMAYAVHSVARREVRVLERGEVTRAGEHVNPGALAMIAGMESALEDIDVADEGAGRAALAEWIADSDNGLTWRSIVNRVWQYHFGRGLVDTPNDFGKAGAVPSHPELLEWLAAEFRDNGQSLKRLHKLIVMSDTYRQSSAFNSANAANAAIDGDNRYLWRMNRRRLESEAIRDAILQVSGALDLTMGGPSVELFDYTYDHSPRYEYVARDDAARYRRSIYRFIVRSVPDPLFEALDCADPNVSTPTRHETLTAAQALSLLNDGFVFQQSRKFAEYLSAYSDDPEKQIARAYDLTLGREANMEERNALRSYVEAHGLAQLARLIFNLNEFIFVD